MCCHADLVAAIMFLQRLSRKEIRTMVALACRNVDFVEQPGEVDDENFEEELHVSYMRVPRFQL